MKLLVAPRGILGVLAWSVAAIALAFGLVAAHEQYTHDDTAAHARWGEAISGLVVASSGNNGDITTALIQYTSPQTGTQEEVTRIMPVSYQLSTRPTVWEGVDGTVFVHDAASSSHFSRWETDPWPNPLWIYGLWLMVACIIAAPSFFVELLADYLLIHRLSGKAPSS